MIRGATTGSRVPVYSTDHLEQTCCPGCGSPSSERLAEEFGLGIQRCRACTLIYVSPRLREHQGHYHGDRDSIVAKYGRVLRGEAGHTRDSNYREELAHLRRMKPTGKLLDVGTHCGFFLRMARGMGWELSGVEPSPAAELGREFFGLNIHQGHLEALSFPSASFDVITVIDVVEHIGDPLGLLREINRLLKPDGLVFVKTPNAHYNLFKHYLLRRLLKLDRLEIFDAKEHVVHYTRDTLRAVLRQAGLQVVHDFVPLPVQDGAAWKCALRSTAHGLARIHHALSGGRFGPLATDLAFVSRKMPQTHAD
jgi:SAM-dependent methyltransferase